MEGVGLVTVSLRRSMRVMLTGRFGFLLTGVSDEGRKDFVREKGAGGSEPEHVAFEFY